MKKCALCVGLIAVGAIGSVAVPTSGAARSAGGGVGVAAGIHGVVRHGGPAFLHGPRSAFARSFATRRVLRPIDQRRQQVSVLPSWLGYADFEPFYYYPPADPAVTGSVAESANEPVAGPQPPPNRVLVVKPGCRTEEQKVPAEAGGERLIHITRCY